MDQNGMPRRQLALLHQYFLVGFDRRLIDRRIRSRVFDLKSAVEIRNGYAEHFSSDCFIWVFR